MYHGESVSPSLAAATPTAETPLSVTVSAEINVASVTPASYIMPAAILIKILVLITFPPKKRYRIMPDTDNLYLACQLSTQKMRLRKARIIIFYS